MMIFSFNRRWVYITMSDFVLPTLWMFIYLQKISPYFL